MYQFSPAESTTGLQLASVAGMTSTGTTTEVRPGVWRLRVFTGRDANGRPVQVSKTVHLPKRGTKRAVQEALNEFAAEVQARNGKPTDDQTVAGLLDQWLEHLESLGRSPTTMRKYRQIADAEVRPALGDTPLRDLTARDLDTLYAKLTKRGLAPTSVRRVHALLSASLHQAEKWGLVDRNVARQATPPPIHAEQTSAPTPERVQELIEAAEAIEPMMANLLFLAALTGCRRGELCALRWSDVDWQNGTLTIARSVYEKVAGGWGEKSTKSHAVRRVALDPVAIALLKRHKVAGAPARKLGIEGPADDAFMFSRSPQGLEPLLPNVVTKFVNKLSGGDVHMHQLRHFSATMLVAAGTDIRTVSYRLGHADASVTLRIYSHALPELDRKAAKTIGRTLSLPRARMTKPA